MANTTLPANDREVPEGLITGGVDTHLDVHVAAALDPIGGLLGTESFPTTPAGYCKLATTPLPLQSSTPASTPAVASTTAPTRRAST